jgi:hypothetical protein
MVQPVSREGHALIYNKYTHSLFLIGGKNFDFLSEIFELKIDNLQWAPFIPSGYPMPALSNFSYSQTKNKILIYGGQMADC